MQKGREVEKYQNKETNQTELKRAFSLGLVA